MSVVIVRNLFDDTNKCLLGESKELVCYVVLVVVIVVFDGFYRAFNCLVEKKMIFGVFFEDVERTTVWGQVSKMGVETKLSELECHFWGVVEAR